MKTETTTNKSSVERRSAGSEDYTRAMLNILEDFTAEKKRMEESQKAIVNILEDFALEKERLEDVQHAVINILEDFTGEKDRLEEIQRAVLNILQDSSDEKAKLEEVRKAMLNLLEDFDVERSRTEEANRELRVVLESIRKAKEAADAANRELAAFSYSVSHDLRAPLRALDGFSQALIEDYYDILDEEGHGYLNRIRAASQRMALLIDDLLKLSRLTRGELNLGPVDLSALARAIAAELQKTEPTRKVDFRITEGLNVTADPNLLKIVLENLLGNAWKFTGRKEDAVIELGSGTAQTYFVRDNGAGFDMTYEDKLFGVFQRLHSDKDFSGSGIGLSIVQRIILRHGGKVWAEGEIGKGAIFYFTLGT